jgi:NADPH:quinone reductase-like Zn-dependent oxidoreductase
VKAAVVSSFDAPPRYADFPEPVTADEDEIIISVLAAGLHPRVRSQADGSHYTSTGVLPLVPGVDGVGRDPAGVLRYFVLEDTTLGSMAERIAIDPRRSIVLPPGCAPVAIAAAMNPAMSSWIALRQRIEFTPGGSVLVLGATGNAGRMAVQVARLLGANQVIAVGRNADLLAELPALGATSTILLDDDADLLRRRLGQAATDLDVVLDYLWGQPAASVLTAVVTARADRGKPLTWIEIGSVAGLAAPIPSAALRAARLQMIGSGQGSVASSAILAELPGLAGEISKGTFGIDVHSVPLADVERAWADAGLTRHRTVITCSPC